MSNIPIQHKIEIKIIKYKGSILYYCNSSDFTTDEKRVVKDILDTLNSQDVSIITIDNKDVKTIVSTISKDEEYENNKKYLEEIEEDSVVIGSFMLFIYTSNMYTSDHIWKINGRYEKEEGPNIIEAHKVNPYHFFNQFVFIDEDIKAPIIHVFNMPIDQVQKKMNNARYYNITDSSIWNYLVIRTAKNKDLFHKDIVSVVKKIVDNHEHHYYKLDIAHEYVNLNARLTMQAFIVGISHSDKMSPFLFHSERQLCKLWTEDAENHKLDALNIEKYYWRALLLDDKTNSQFLSPDKFEVTKDKILKERIDDMLGVGSCVCVPFDESKINELFDEIVVNEIDKKPKLVILCVENIEDAEKALKYFKFDFIFLDYLLAGNEYGYQLLDKLAESIGKDGDKLKSTSFVVGPDQRFFFMFISAFTTAISERLRLQGWARSEEIWYIAEGACPTNTPQLFCYNLRKMMVKRIKDSGVEKLSTVKIFDLVWDVYLPLQKDPQRSSVRKRAIEHYQDFMSLLYIYHRILKDVEIPKSQKNIFTTRGSVFMTSFNIRHNHLGGLLEHLSQLVHLTAFGTVRQWPEMWEEYLFFKAQFQDLYNDPNELQEIEKIDIHKLYDNIEQHILGLKSL